MRYITGQQALNIDCLLETCGDWHTSALDWEELNFCESDNSFFGDYGIELDKIVPCHPNLFPVANHIRALLDLLDAGSFSLAQGMRDDFICNNKYTAEIFAKVFLLKTHTNWQSINKFMGDEYKTDWLNFLESKNNLPFIETQTTTKLELVTINNATADEINAVFLQKTNGYAAKNNLQDLYNICFIYNNFSADLSKLAISNLQNTLCYKGVEHFNYLVNLHGNNTSNIQDLIKDFLQMYTALGLEINEDERKIIANLQSKN